MALLWEKKNGDVHYEVRSAGNSRRLYTNGVLHSAYNPQQPLTGSIWDLLFLPALYCRRENLKRILILGAGGGAVMNLLNRYVEPEHIIAVDIDAVHLMVAEKYFNAGQSNVELVHADAIEWVRGYRGAAFDMVIEDLFIEQDQQPIRLMHEDKSWLRSLRALTTDDGTLVINHGDSSEARFTRGAIPASVRICQFSQPLLQNRVLVLRRASLSSELLNQNLQQYGLRRDDFNFHMKTFKSSSRA